MFQNPAWRKRPLTMAFRVLQYHVRKRIPAWRYVVVPHDGGRSRVVADMKTRHGYTLFMYGHEDPDLQLVRTLLSPGDICIDGGAHVGLLTLVAASKVGSTGRVISFEPSPDTHRLLERNIALNGFAKVEARAQALSDAAGERTFLAFEGDVRQYSSFAPPAHLTGGQSHQVQVVTLDSILSPAERQKLRLVKLDLEGAEVHALRGAETLLRDGLADFLIEVETDHLERQGSSVEELLTLFKDYGYQMFRPGWDAEKRLILAADALPPDPRRPNLLFTRQKARLAATGIPLLAEE